MKKLPGWETCGICNSWVMNLSSHLWSFGFVLSVEELRKSSSLNFMDADKKTKKLCLGIKLKKYTLSKIYCGVLG